MPEKQNLLRQIPKVDELLSHPAISSSPSHSNAAGAVRETLAALREKIKGGMKCLPSEEQLVAEILETLQKKDTLSLRRVINATGVVLHTNLGRAPLAKSAVEAVCAASKGYSTLEYQVSLGMRGSRYSHVDSLLTRITGAEDALVVNNNAAAVLLMLSAVAPGKEVIVSRGELVEIGGAFRIPDVMEQSGALLREVGTTNRTRRSDYEDAILPGQTGALFKAHTSNYKILGFTEDVAVEELVAVGKRHGLPVLHDLGSGSLLPPGQFGIPDEPSVIQSVQAGADLVSFSGDKLLGGPQAGIIIGSKELVSRMKKHPLTRAVRIDKLTLAALEATLRLYLDPEKALAQIPALRMLAAGKGLLLRPAQQLAALLEPLGGQAKVTSTDSQVGGGSAPGQLLPSYAVAISPRHMPVAELESRLRGCAVPIVARISQDRLLLDVRTIEEGDYAYIASQILSILGVEGGLPQ